MENNTPLRPVDLGNGRNTETHEHHSHSHLKEIDPIQQQVDYINFVAQQLQIYNQKVAKIMHKEHLLKN